MTGYSGTLDPETLLTTQGKAHGELYNATGCNGVCHNALIVPRTGMVGGDPDTYFQQLAASAAAGAEGTATAPDHSYINSCVDCHAVGPFPLDLHGTHAVLIDNERSAGADSESGYEDGCSYCHTSGNPKNTEGSDSFGKGGGCYNCHLSGHSPETVYWSGAPAAPVAPTGPQSQPLDETASVPGDGAAMAVADNAQAEAPESVDGLGGALVVFWRWVTSWFYGNPTLGFRAPIYFVASLADSAGLATQSGAIFH